MEYVSTTSTYFTCGVNQTSWRCSIYVVSSLHFLTIELVSSRAVLLWHKLLLQQLGTYVHTYRCAAVYGMCPVVHYRAGLTSGQPTVCITVNMWLVACDELYSWYVHGGVWW